MGMYKCIKCGDSMCDPDLYNRAPGETRQAGSSTKAPSGKFRVKCYGCNKIQTIKEMHEKELKNESAIEFFRMIICH